MRSQSGPPYLVAARVQLLVLPVLQVDIGFHHLRFRECRRRHRDIAQHRDRGIVVSTLDGQLTIRDQYAHFLRGSSG